MCTDCPDKPSDRRSEQRSEPGTKPTTLSNISCLSCRRRKIRCNRELPNCQVCVKSGHSCEYPAATMRPGPKIGSMFQSRKRKRTAGSDGSEVSRESRAPREWTSPREDSSTTDLEASSATVTNPQHTRDAEDTVQTRHSPNYNDDDAGARQSSVNMHDLSFTLHPSHEIAISNKAASPSSTHVSENEKSFVITRAANALGLTPDMVENLIAMYFDNMTSIKLFREPYFAEKIQNIESPTITHALLAAMISFSSRFCGQEDSEGGQYGPEAFGGVENPHLYFRNLASQLVDQALEEYDDPPPLSLLQAALLVAHGQLTQGVRGKAWRSLGTCVRVAYELNLHLGDSGHASEDLEVDTEQWCDREEKRRAWWAIWEMDVFASTIRRCPTAIDRSRNETLLPVEDEHWFRGEPSASCFLELDLTRRWSALQRCGNISAKAWFIVINSLMKDAQYISSPTSILSSNVPPRGCGDASQVSKQRMMAGDPAEDAAEKLETIANSVRCFVLALPASLRFRNQCLGFHAQNLSGQTASTSSRQQHHGIYNIEAMTQLATLMIRQFALFSPGRSGSSRNCPNPRSKSRGHEGSWGDSRGSIETNSVAVDQFFEAADGILSLVNRSADNHIQWINPFLASTIWLAAAVQLVRKEFGPYGTNRGLVKSKFDVLYLTYQKCVWFWDIQTALQQNLESLEAQLHTYREENKRPDEMRRQKANYQDDNDERSWTNEGHDRHGEQRPRYSSLPRKSSIVDQPWDRSPRSVGIQNGNQGSIPLHQSRQSSYALITPETLIAASQQQQRESTDWSPQKETAKHQQEQFRQDMQQQQRPQSLSAMHAEPLSPPSSTLDIMQFPAVEKTSSSLSLLSSGPGVAVATSGSDAACTTNTAFLDTDLFSSAIQDYPMSADMMEELDTWPYVLGDDLGLSNFVNELLVGGYQH